MEKHVFKVSDGGEFSGDGFSYDCKCVSRARAVELVNSGWSYHLENPEQGSDHEADLREQIKALGGKAGGRSSIETLEKQLEELKNGSDS